MWGREDSCLWARKEPSLDTQSASSLILYCPASNHEKLLPFISCPVCSPFVKIAQMDYDSVQVVVWDPAVNSSGYIPRSEAADMVILDLISWGIAKRFSIGSAPLYIPTSRARGSHCTMSLPTLIIFHVLKNNHPWAARVAQQFSATFSPGPDPGDPGSIPMSGSLHGACLTLPVSLPLSLCVSHE